MATGAIEPFWAIIERHLDEADYLAATWRDALDEPDHTLAELARGIEARLFAHLDGLVLAGSPSLERVLWAALGADADISRALVATLAILEQGTNDECARILAVLDATQTGDERWTGIVEGLALHSPTRTGEWLVAQLDGREAESGPRVAGIAHALARRRVALGDRLTALLHNADPMVSSAAAILARRGSSNQLNIVAGLGHHEDQRVVAAAVETALVRGLSGAWASARYWAFDAPACGFRRTALTWMALGEERDDHRRLITLLDAPTLRRDVLWATSFCGRIEAVDAAVGLLRDDALAPMAAEVITAIAGLPTGEESAEQSLWREVEWTTTEEQALPQLADDRLDADLTLEPEQLLPIPDPDAVIRWWSAHRPSVDPGARLIAGEPLDASSLDRAFIAQPLRRRHALGLLIQLRTGAAVWPSTRDWASAQLREL